MGYRRRAPRGRCELRCCGGTLAIERLATRDEPDSAALSSAGAEGWSKVVLAFTGFALVFTGFALFLLPEAGAESFAWRVSPFLAMTIGGWAVGMGLMALDAARLWRRNGLSRVYPSVLAVWAFCVLQALVVLVSLPALRTDNWLTYPYLVALGLGVISAVLGARALWQRRAIIATQGDGVPRWVRVTYGVFALGVFLLAAAAVALDTSTGSVVPEPLSPFSARAFAAFLVALGIGALPLFWTRDSEPAAQYARAGLILDVLTLTPAAVFLSTFNFAERPGGLIYLGAYVIAGVIAVLIIRSERRPDLELSIRH